MNSQHALPWLQPGEPFPPIAQAWPEHSPAPGLVAAGGVLDVATLHAAYTATLFPWFSARQPILWWSPDPRMVLQVARFRLHRSLRRTVQRFATRPGCEIRFNHAFEQVIHACARIPRPGQGSTWIGPDMRQAYVSLHHAGYAHSVETWVDGRLVAGLYGVGIGRAVFGESMFTTVSDGSKIALAALVAWCLEHGVPLIDCQQNTPHLASLGAAEVSRDWFAGQVHKLATEPAPPWRFQPLYWQHLLSPTLPPESR